MFLWVLHILNGIFPQRPLDVSLGVSAQTKVRCFQCGFRAGSEMFRRFQCGFWDGRFRVRGFRCVGSGMGSDVGFGIVFFFRDWFRDWCLLVLEILVQVP